MIPFIQYLRPNGRIREIRVERPEAIERLAREVMVAGGRFECEELMDGTVSLTVAHDDEDESGPWAIQLCSNGPKVPETVDVLVREAAAHLDADRAGRG